MRFFLFVTLALLGCQNSNSEHQNSDIVKAPADETPPLKINEFQFKPVAGLDLQQATKMNNLLQVIEQGFVRDGKREGAWSTFLEGEDAGRIKILANYSKDKRNGIYLEFSNRGQVKLRANYLNGELDGYWAKYDWGRVTEEANYKNGKLHGDYKSYFKDSNKVQKFVQFKDGKQDGLFQQFDEHGTLLAKYEYKNGEKISGGVVE